MLSRRLQILIDDDRLRRLEAEAARRQVAVSVVVRDAIDAAYPIEADRRAQAIDTILGADPMPVPPPGELGAELDDLRGRRA